MENPHASAGKSATAAFEYIVDYANVKKQIHTIWCRLVAADLKLVMLWIFRCGQSNISVPCAFTLNVISACDYQNTRLQISCS